MSKCYTKLEIYLFWEYLVLWKLLIYYFEYLFETANLSQNNYSQDLVLFAKKMSNSRHNTRRIYSAVCGCIYRQVYNNHSCLLSSFGCLERLVQWWLFLAFLSEFKALSLSSLSFASFPSTSLPLPDSCNFQHVLHFSDQCTYYIDVIILFSHWSTLTAYSQWLSSIPYSR